MQTAPSSPHTHWFGNSILLFLSEWCGILFYLGGQCTTVSPSGLTWMQLDNSFSATNFTELFLALHPMTQHWWKWCRTQKVTWNKQRKSISRSWKQGTTHNFFLSAFSPANFAVVDRTLFPELVRNNESKVEWTCSTKKNSAINW